MIQPIFQCENSYGCFKRTNIEVHNLFRGILATSHRGRQPPGPQRQLENAEQVAGCWSKQIFREVLYLPPTKLLAFSIVFTPVASAVSVLTFAKSLIEDLANVLCTRLIAEFQVESEWHRLRDE